MGNDLQEALRQFDPSKGSSGDLKKIVVMIQRLLLESEGLSVTEQDLQEKIKVEEKEVKKAKERLQGLTESSRDGSSVKVGETEDELWGQFGIHRTSVVSEILVKDQKSLEANGSITQKQSDGLRRIADSALEVCCQQYEEQQTKLCAALMLDATKPTSERQDLSEVKSAVSTFQTELQYEIVPFLMEKLCQKLSSATSNMKVETKKSEDEWIINFDKTKDIRIKGSSCEKFMKTSLEVCWKLRNRYKNVKFYWDVQEKPNSFSLPKGLIPEAGWIQRVYIPAVYKDKESLIRKGKYTFVPNNTGNNTREGTDAMGTNTCEKTDKRGTEVRSKVMGSLKDETTATKPTREGTTENGTTREKSSEGKTKSSGVWSAGKKDPVQKDPPTGSVAGSDPLISLPHTEENGGTTNKGNLRPHKDKPSAGSETVDSTKIQENLDF
ncbi:uncharacterized protein LOC111122531 [Crassostrea virginica]